MRLAGLTLAIAMGLGMTLPCQADTQRKRSNDAISPYMRVHGETPPPFGFVQFCEGFPAECHTTDADDQRFAATPAHLSELDEVNRLVNRNIQPATDAELYGVTELWTLPRDKGDCEDYALLKRHILIARGWPASALLVTVVRDEKREGHAILTARTLLGDFVLDNKLADVRIWHKTPYEFVMRQSYLNPKVWMSLDLGHPNTPMPIAGARPRH